MSVPPQPEDKPAPVADHIDGHGNSDNDVDTKAIDKALAAGEAVQMRSELDNLPIHKAFGVFRRVAALCMLAAFASALEGYQYTLTASIVANKGFIRQMSDGGTKLAAEHVAVWGGMLSSGQFVGVLGLQACIDRLGRKWAMHLTWLALVVSIAVESVSSNWVHWTVAKLIAGMGLGMMQATYPVYISELSPTQIRGGLTTAYQFWNVLSHIFSPLALRELSYSDPYNFKAPIYTQWGMLAVMLAINLFVPESPWWLVQKNRIPQAEKVLAFAYKGVKSYNVKEQLSIIVATVERHRLINVEEKSQLKEIFTGINLWRLLIAFWPKAMQQLVGQSLTNNYGTYFFQLAGNSDPFTVTMILALCQLVGVMACALLSDRFGKRWFTIGMFGSAAVAVLCIGIVGCFDYTSKELGSLLVFFGCVSNFGCIGGAGIAYTYVAEIPTQRLRARTGSVALLGSFLLGILFNYTVPFMLQAWSVKSGFFFGTVGILSCAVGWYILPEMARRTPAEIDEMFQDKIKPRAFRNHVTQVQIYLQEKEEREREVQEKLE
ncbi:general substrate transporter [Thozetella sp. PMI_491]|nr:general substrate transporter [Thozetella sp. PMI_491]